MLDQKSDSALTILAQRIDPNNNGWFTMMFYSTKLGCEYICNICNQPILADLTTSGKSLTDHGITHLKEHNLLPFI